MLMAFCKLVSAVSIVAHQLSISARYKSLIPMSRILVLLFCSVISTDPGNKQQNRYAAIHNAQVPVRLKHRAFRGLIFLNQTSASLYFFDGSIGFAHIHTNAIVNITGRNFFFDDLYYRLPAILCTAPFYKKMKQYLIANPMQKHCRNGCRVFINQAPG